ncbi:hypothetical protein H5T58_01570 [Candidatus Parcubacteria bacterium]|nr:hypothetical protein [Candidatus Parcubacteria bacterium]
MENFLKEKGIKAKEREFILEIAKGRPGRMIEILNDKNLFQQYQNLKEMAEKFEKIPLSQRLELIKEISQKEEFLEFLTKKLEREVLSPFTQQRAISLLKLIQSFFYYFYAFKVDKQMALEILALQI